MELEKSQPKEERMLSHIKLITNEPERTHHYHVLSIPCVTASCQSSILQYAVARTRGEYFIFVRQELTTYFYVFAFNIVKWAYVH